MAFIEWVDLAVEAEVDAVEVKAPSKKSKAKETKKTEATEAETPPQA
jgi:hypothetical protein